MDFGYIQFYMQYANQHPVLFACFATIGMLRVSFKPAMALIESYVKSTQTDEDDKALEQIESSKWFKGFCWAIDLIASVKVSLIQSVNKK